MTDALDKISLLEQEVNRLRNLHGEVERLGNDANTSVAQLERERDKLAAKLKKAEVTFVFPIKLCIMLTNCVYIYSRYVGCQSSSSSSATTHESQE